MPNYWSPYTLDAYIAMTEELTDWMIDLLRALHVFLSSRGLLKEFYKENPEVRKMVKEFMNAYGVSRKMVALE